MKKSINSVNSIEKIVTGTIEITNSIGFVGNCFISKENLNGACSGDTVKIEKLDQNPNILNYKVVEIITSAKSFLEDIKNSIKTDTDFLLNDKKWQNSLDELNILIKNKVDVNFSKEVQDEVEQMSEKIDQNEIQKRTDLRGLFTITIDGPDTKDIDDAISVEKLSEGGYKLYVHIADVSHFVKDGSHTQKEALKRGTSIYFLDKVVPMIPEKLSNGLCSLNPFEDKLTLTCEMIFDKEGNIDLKKSKVYESIIKSNARTTYKEVQNVFDQKITSGELKFGGKIDDVLQEMIRNSYALAFKINEKRKKDGELVFDNTEQKIELDEKRDVKNIKKYEMYESNELIKSFMVQANEVVSKLYGNGPFLHRTHEKPSEEKIELLQKILTYMQVDTKGIDLSINNLDKLLKIISQNKDEKVLKRLILQTLKLARYTHTLEGHHGLALTNYSHFTSPIRRYPDFCIHQIIKKHISGQVIDDINLEEIAKISSEREMLAEKIESQINILKNISYLEKNLKKEFEATIMQLNERGVTVELDFGNINGNLEIDEKSRYNIELVDAGICEIKNKKEIIKLGSKVKVKVKSLDKINLKINFELI